MKTSWRKRLRICMAVKVAQILATTPGPMASFRPHDWRNWPMSIGCTAPPSMQELYGLLPTFHLPPTFSLLLVTKHLVLEVFARQLWKSLPSNVRSCDCETLRTFRRHLKSHLFHSAFPTVYIATHLSGADLFTTTALYKSASDYLVAEVIYSLLMFH